MWDVTQGTYIGCLMYADYIILLSASVGSLLDICYVSGTEIDIVFNVKNQLCLLLVKHDVTVIEDLKIGHDTISWSHRLKYLGLHFKRGRTVLANNETVGLIRKFYAAVNAV